MVVDVHFVALLLARATGTWPKKQWLSGRSLGGTTIINKEIGSIKNYDNILGDMNLINVT